MALLEKTDVISNNEKKLKPAVEEIGGAEAESVTTKRN